MEEASKHVPHTHAHDARKRVSLIYARSLSICYDWQPSFPVPFNKGEKNAVVFYKLEEMPTRKRDGNMTNWQALQGTWMDLGEQASRACELWSATRT